MWPNPHQWQQQQPTLGPQHSLHDPGPRPMSMRVAQRTGQQEAAPVPFPNPDPIAHLVGCSNEALVIVDGQRMTALINSRYVQVNLQIPGIKNYNEDVLLLVIPTMTYSEKTPVVVGSKIIDQTMRIIKKGELMKATTTWKQAHFGGCHVGVPTAAPLWLKWNQGER